MIYCIKRLTASKIPTTSSVSKTYFRKGWLYFLTKGFVSQNNWAYIYKLHSLYLKKRGRKNTTWKPKGN